MFKPTNTCYLALESFHINMLNGMERIKRYRIITYAFVMWLISFSLESFLVGIMIIFSMKSFPDTKDDILLSK